MFEVNNKDTRNTTSVFIVNFEHISRSSVSIINFEHGNADRVVRTSSNSSAH